MGTHAGDSLYAHTLERARRAIRRDDADSVRDDVRWMHLPHPLSCTTHGKRAVRAERIVELIAMQRALTEAGL